MGKEIAAKIEANKGRAALSRKEQQTNREVVKELAAKHMEAAITKLSEIVTDKNAPASAKVAAATQLLDRVAGKPKLIDERQTEHSALERMSVAEVLQYICDIIPSLSAQARAAIAQSVLAAERGVTIDVRDIVDEDFSEAEQSAPAGLPPLKPRKEPRR